MPNLRKRYCQHYQRHLRKISVRYIINTVCFIHEKDSFLGVDRVDMSCRGAGSFCKHAPPQSQPPMRGFPRSKMRGNGPKNFEEERQQRISVVDVVVVVVVGGNSHSSSSLSESIFGNQASVLEGYAYGTFRPCEGCNWRAHTKVTSRFISLPGKS